MAPLMQAIRTAQIPEDCKENTTVYEGLVDPEWTYDGFPHGGFVLALVVDAAIQFQSKTPRKDDTLKLTTILLFGSFGVKVTGHSLNLAVPSPLARCIPIYTHPSYATLTKKIPQARFNSRMQWSFDPAPLKRNRLLYLSSPESANQTSEPTTGRRAGGGGIEWSAWWDWVDKDTVLNAATLSFLSDAFQRLPDLLSWAQGSGDSVSWSYTTLVLNIEFKAPIPDASEFSRRSVGLYSEGTFIREGIHDGRVEIWTAPSGIGEGVAVPGWRERQICLAVASQVTLAVPLGSKRIGKRIAQENLKPKL
ncbi:hypothetical protein B0H13DRAFT_2364821 [Mycena leptocephala]|nr:hypothetical protein B0H13DRAFT_2364821 [Mycena leptocephala]